MKKIVFIFGIAFAFSSCADCKDCTFESGSVSTFENGSKTKEVCRDDFASNEDYQAALLALEQLGADCK